MKSRLFLALFILNSSISSGQKVNTSAPVFVINGQLKNAGDQMLYLSGESVFSGKPWQDSVRADKDGKFVFKGMVAEPTYFILQVGPARRSTGFYVENVPMHVSGDANAMWSAKVTGSEEEYIRKKFDEIYAASDYESVAAELNTAKGRNDTVAIRQAEYNEAQLYEKEKIAMRQLMLKYPLAAASINQLNRYISSHQEKDLYTADSLLRIYERSKVAQYKQVAYFRKEYEGAKKLVIGQPAPDFSQPDTAGNEIKLSDFKGKYVLVDFWASWCGPCREENPNLVNAFRAFKNKNFQILSVSLDSNRSKWVKAIAADHLDWYHVSDLKYWKNQVARAYSVSSIPFNLLLDPEGRVIALNLKGMKLNDTLNFILK